MGLPRLRFPSSLHSAKRNTALTLRYNPPPPPPPGNYNNNYGQGYNPPPPPPPHPSGGGYGGGYGGGGGGGYGDGRGGGGYAPPTGAPPPPQYQQTSAGYRPPGEVQMGNYAPYGPAPGEWALGFLVNRVKKSALVIMTTWPAS